MTTSSLTWFYQQPENNPYLIAERVRTNFWDARFGSLWLDTVKADSPILMKGHYKGSAVELEWEPSKWCILRTNPGNAALAQGVSNLIRFRPSFQYEDPLGSTIWEWRLTDADSRWQAIQGRPGYGQLQRLKK
jgi:hypothetical protein